MIRGPFITDTTYRVALFDEDYDTDEDSWTSDALLKAHEWIKGKRAKNPKFAVYSVSGLPGNVEVIYSEP